MAGTSRSGRRPKWAMIALRKLQEEKVEEAERSFAILAEMAQMERLPKDWEARRQLCNDVMSRVWGMPKAKTELSGDKDNPVNIALTAVDYRNGLDALKPE